MEIRPGYFEIYRQLKNRVEATEISGIPVLDQQRVLRAAQEIYPEVLEWVRPYPAILPTRVPSTCLACAAMCPGESNQVIIEATILSMVLFGLDDVVDGAVGVISDAQIEKAFTLYGAIAASPFEDVIGKRSPQEEAEPWLQIARALAESCRRLRAYPGAELYYPFYARRFRLLMETMRQELHWRQQSDTQGTLPTYEDYLVNGAESIVAPTVLGAVLILVGPVLEDIPLKKNEAIIEEMALAVGAVVRLTNDVRTVEREQLEGKPNSLVIRMRNGASEKEAEAAAIADANFFVERLNLLQESLSPEFKTWGDYARRLAWFTRDWYMVRDFYQFTKEMLADLAQVTANNKST